MKQAFVPNSNTIVGTYMCQGKVSDTIQERIKGMKPEMYAAIKDMLEESLHHPDEEDIIKLLKKI